MALTRNQMLMRVIARDAIANAKKAGQVIAPAYVTKWTDIVKYQVPQGHAGAGTWIDTKTSFADYYIDGATDMWSRDAYRGDFHNQEGVSPSVSPSVNIPNSGLSFSVGIPADVSIFRGVLKNILVSIWPNGPMSLFNSRKAYNQSVVNLPPETGYRTYYGIETAPSFNVLRPNYGDLDYMSVNVMDGFIHYMQTTYSGVDWD